MAYRVLGSVRRNDNGQGIPNLTVKAYDSDWISSDDYLGTSVTDSSGNFDISFQESDFDAGWWDPEGGPDLFVKIYTTNNRLIYRSEIRTGAGQNTSFDIRIDPLDVLGEYTVSGIISDARSTRRLCNLNVEAWDDDWIFDDILGTDRSDVIGTYLIPFERSTFSSFWDFLEGRPDVYVKIVNDDGRLLATSSVRDESDRHSSIDVSVAGIEISRSVSECVFGWTAAYRQEGTHVIVRIRLNPDSGITDQEMATLRNTWKAGIENKWSNHFACCCTRRVTNTSKCRNYGTLTFEVQWVNDNPHHTVRVIRGPARSNMTTWDTSDTGDVVSHEFGHMLGNPDEYADSNCPARSPVNTGTVMDDNTEAVRRHVEGVCRLINESAVDIMVIEGGVDSP
jgi:hypothetical protein